MPQATRYIVETKNAADEWVEILAASCPQVVINAGARPSTARIHLADRRWHDRGGLNEGDMVRVISAGAGIYEPTLLFVGTLTARRPNWQPAAESSIWIAQCPKYAMSRRHVIYGQYAFQMAAYTGATWSTGPPAPAADVGGGVAGNTLTFLASGRRCIFNERDSQNVASRQNMENTEADTSAGTLATATPVFGYLDGRLWTIRDMIRYVLAFYSDTTATDHFPQDDPADDPALAHANFDKSPRHFVAEKKNLPQLLEELALLAGHQYRLDWYLSDYHTVELQHVFYPLATTTQDRRRRDNLTRSHRLHSPLPGDDLSSWLDADYNVVTAGELVEDSGPVVNYSVAMGERYVDEIGAGLVPAWKDSQMGWTVSASQKIFYTHAEIKEIRTDGDDPNDKTFFSRHHPAGSSFNTYKDVGRKWALNETGRYNHSDYDRDSSDPGVYLLGLLGLLDEPATITLAEAGYFPRQISECLTCIDADKRKHINYHLQFSLDAGTTWHNLHDFNVELLDNEWGIWIAEPNLADIDLDRKGGVGQGTSDIFSGSDPNTTDGLAMNFWTSLYRDKENDRSYKAGEWKTLVKLTASVQLDDRVVLAQSLSGSGTSLTQVGLYDRSLEYRIRTQRDNSAFSGVSGYTVDSFDESSQLASHQAVVDAANRRRSYSGTFTLPRIFGAQGSEALRRPRFLPGDTITRIEGRGLDLAIGNGEYPWIQQITYNLEQQQTSLVTCDLRMSRIG